jgi:hypothetical protein
MLDSTTNEPSARQEHAMRTNLRPKTTAALAVIALSVGVGTAAIVAGADDSGNAPIPVEPDGGIGETPIPVEPDGGIRETPVPVQSDE